jgi:hypothetical protein
MSDTDSFIDEVTEEVRRDRLYGLMRRYGWIAVLAIVLIVGGTSYSEYRKAQIRGKAEALGDSMVAALGSEESAARATALAEIQADSPAAKAVLRLMTAAEQSRAGENAMAVETLNAIALAGDTPEVYRQIAQFKALTLQGADTPVTERRQALEALANPGSPMRLLASEQLALIDIEQGEVEAAIARLQAILSDAEVTSGLQQRALQVIVALGGEPELGENALAGN